MSRSCFGLTAPVAFAFAAMIPIPGRAATGIPQDTMLAVVDVARSISRNPLNQPAWLDVADVPLEEGLMLLRRQSGVDLAFSPTLLPDHRRVSCRCEHLTVRDALEQLLDGTGHEYALLGNGIVIERSAETGRASRGAARLAGVEPSPITITSSLRTVDRAVPRFRQGTVTGQVVDQRTRQPLASVQVSVAGSSLGTLTEADGRYVLPRVPDGSQRIRAERIGYRAASVEIQVQSGDTTRTNFELAEVALGLERIVVSVAATNARRAEIGTDFEVLDAAQALRETVVSDFSDLLKSRLTGVSITETSGEVGTASLIRVRGGTSLTQDNNPLIILDGVRISNQTGTGVGALGSSAGDGQTVSRLDDINPEDIASFQVLKGPTAAALYGSEAASGVIVIQTKHGAPGESTFTFSTEQSLSYDVTDYPDNYYNLTTNAGITDVNDPRFTQWRPVQNPATGEVFARDNPLENARTNPFRTGASSKYDLSLRGGQEQLGYFTSLNYEDQNGVLGNNKVTRWSLRANVDTRPAEWVDVNISSNFVSADLRFNGTGRSPQSVLTNAMAGLPGFSYGTRPDGSRGDCLVTVLFGDPESLCALQEGNLRGNFDKIMAVRNEQEVGRFTGSITTHVRPTAWFSNRFVVGIDHIQTRNYNLIPLDAQRPFRSLSAGTVRDQQITDEILTAEYAGTTTARLTEALGATTTFGAQYFGTRSENVVCDGSGGFASPTAIACNAALTFSGSSDLEEQVEIGAYVQQQLNLNNYLYVTGAVRVDDNSAFGEQQGAIWSPSANMSAVISEMPFWKVAAVNSLRLRFAWGTAAQAPEPFAAARTFRPVRLDQGGQQVTGISPDDPGNPDLTAERNEEFEFGVDAGFLADRIGLNLTYFTQQTRDAIVGTRVSPGTAFAGTKWVNIGAVENKGVEATLTGRALEMDDVTLDLGLKLSTSDPIVTSLGGLPPILLGPQVEGMFHEGYAPGAYYGPIVQSAERDANGKIVPGSIVYAPGNLNIPGRPDYRYLGRPTPQNEESFSASLSLFGRFHLFTLFHRAAGFSKMNDTEGTRSPFIQNVSGSRLYAFRQAEISPEDQAALENPAADVPQVFVDEADFIKWREFTLRYDVPAGIARSLLGFAKGAAITLGARNLHTWSDYSGFDPEVRLGGGTDDFTSGEFFTMPAPRSFFLRLSTTF